MYETPVWLDVQLNVALVLVVVVVPFAFAGTLAVMVVSAGPSTVHVKDTGVGSAFWAGSIARTSTVCEPGSRPANSAVFSGGEAHSLHSGPPIGSSAHSKLTPISGLAKRKTDATSVLTSAGGPDAIEVSGAVSSSTDHSHSAGTGSASRCSLSAVTVRLCGPPAQPVASARSASSYVMGDSQNVGRPPSSEQSANASGSSTVNVKVADLLVVAAGGPEWIVITGAVTSPTIQLQTSGSRSTAPRGPFARTSSSCSPSGTVIVYGFGHAWNGPRSSEHSNVAPSAGFAANLNVAVWLPVSSSGPLTIVVSGPASVVNTCDAGVGSTFSNWSTARTRSSCRPPASSSSGM